MTDDELRLAINELVAQATGLRDKAGRGARARHLSLVVTHLEDAALRARAASETKEAP